MEHIQPKVMCKCIHLLVVTSVTHCGRTKYARKAIRTPGYKIEEFTCALPAYIVFYKRPFNETQTHDVGFPQQIALLKGAV